MDEESDSDAVGRRYYDSDGKFKWESASSSSGDSESEGQESEDDIDYSDQLSGVWSLDEEEPQEDKGSNVKEGKRLAVTNLDWDSIGAEDILAVFNSLCTQGSSSMRVDKVEIYPSQFGLEQMKNDSLYGPPKEMFKNKPKSR